MNPDGSVRIERLGNPAYPPQGMYALLCAAFDEPPYEGVAEKMTKRIAAWPDFRAVPGFTVATAHDGDELIGVCFGWQSMVGRPEAPAMFAGLYDLLAARPDADRMRGTEIVELAVLPAYRGAGVAQRLLAALCAGGPGWLLSHRQAPAHGWYVRRGWIDLGLIRDDDPYAVLVSQPTVAPISQPAPP